MRFEHHKPETSADQLAKAQSEILRFAQDDNAV
jgi:hypothetical protein